MPRAARTREQWQVGDGGRGGGGGDRDLRARAESDSSERKTALRSVPLWLRSKSESPGREAEGEINIQERKERRDQAEEREADQREGQRAESAEEGAEGLRGGAWESQGEDPRVPAESAGAWRSRGAPLTAPTGLRGRRSTAELRRHRPAGGERGKCEAPERRWGAELTFQARAGPASRIGRAGGPRALTSRRAGQGRAGPGWTASGTRAAGVCPSLEARAGPSSQCRAEANGAPSPPTLRAAAPPGWPPGRAGGRGWGDWVPGSPAEAFLENAARGRAHARGEDAWESKPRPRATWPG